MQHEWQSYAPHYFNCPVCGASASNAAADGSWKFGAGVDPKVCPGPQRKAETRSFAKPATAWPTAKPKAWPTQPTISVDSNVKPPQSWPTASAPAEDSNKHAERKSAWPTAKPAWPTSR